MQWASVLALAICIAIVLAMIAIPFALVRLYLRVPHAGVGKGLMSAHIVAVEAIAASFLLSIGELLLWPAPAVPIVVPVIGGILLVTGVVGAFWTGWKLAHVE